MLSGDGPEAAEKAQKLTLAVQGLTSKGAKEARAKRTAEAASVAEAAELVELALLEAMVAKEEAALKSEQQQLAEDTKALLELQAKVRRTRERGASMPASAPKVRTHRPFQGGLSALRTLTPRRFSRFGRLGRPRRLRRKRMRISTRSATSCCVSGSWWKRVR